MIEMLLSILIVTSDHKPAPHALIQCDEIRRHTDEQGSDDDNLDEDGLGAILKTDSRGRMVFNGVTELIHCRAWLGDAMWKGTIAPNQGEVTIVLTRPKPVKWWMRLYYGSGLTR